MDGAAEMGLWSSKAEWRWIMTITDDHCGRLVSVLVETLLSPNVSEAAVSGTTTAESGMMLRLFWRS